MLGQILGYSPDNGYMLIKGSDGESYYCYEKDVCVEQAQEIQLGMTLDFMPINTGFERKASQVLIHTQFQFEIITPPFSTEGDVPEGLTLNYLHPIKFSATSHTRRSAEKSLMDMACRCGFNGILNLKTMEIEAGNRISGEYTAEGDFAVVTKRGHTVDAGNAARQSSYVALTIQKAQHAARKELANQRSYFEIDLSSYFKAFITALAGR